MLALMRHAEPGENLEGMNEAITDIKPVKLHLQYVIHLLKVKKSVRTTLWVSLIMELMLLVQMLEEVTKQLVETLVDEDSGLVSLYYGEDVT